MTHTISLTLPTQRAFTKRLNVLCKQRDTMLNNAIMLEEDDDLSFFTNILVHNGDDDDLTYGDYLDSIYDERYS